MGRARCFNEVDEALFERGYPHLVILVDDPPKPVPLAKLYKDFFGAYSTEWPRSTARAFVRAAVVGSDVELETEEAAAAAAKPGDIDRDEAAALIRAMLSRVTRGNHYSSEHFLFCLEALVGTDIVLEVLAAELGTLDWNRVARSEKVLQADPDAVWPTHDAEPGMLAYLAGYLLLRASPAAADAARTTLEALWNRTVEADAVACEESLRGALDLALHGMAAVKRVLVPSHWQYVNWWGFVDDADMIRTRYADTAKSDFDPDPRLAWVAGDSIVELSCTKKLVRAVGVRRKAFFEQMGKLDHPAVAAMMAEWIDDKRGGEVAARYLAAHGSAPKKVTAAKVAKKPAPKKPVAKKPAAKKLTPKRR